MENIRHKNIKPTYDLVVKKVFRNEEVALQFVKDIFELPAKSAKLIEGNQIFTANSNVESDFNIAVDILVELDNNAQVIIEVQLAKQVFFINRIWAYLCKQVNDNIERLKQNEEEQLAIYKKLPPVYVAAIVDQNYFDGDEAISTFLIKEETRNTELKMYVENNTQDIPLLKIVFLELKKYKENLNNDYKKIRWLEFFGNKQYTSEPDDVLIQADNLLNLRNWTKEEKRMYDEMTRQQDHYWASLTYAQEEGMRLGIEQGIERGIGLGIEKGIEQGIERGIEQAVITLMKNGYISAEVAAAQLKVDIEDLDKYL
ncbi:Rpn family recombination-promoting nuclease/putative transposase [Gemella sp.]